MERIGVRELRQNASRYLARVANGETIEVTTRGFPVAHIVPVPKGETTWEDLVRSGQMWPAEDDSDFEDPQDFGIDASAILMHMRDDERY
ncbi:MAG: type II toxin-antitoxin system Phd/YefM family antitoxin [Acidimicrobiia bacterium]